MKIKLDGWKTGLRFSACHLIPHHRKCGRLHGHSYAMHVEIEGEPGEHSGLIMDFGNVKKRVREIAASLDHKFILPTRHPAINFTETGDGSISMNAAGKKYVLPAEDVVKLDLEYTTAEHLAEYFLEDICRILPGNVEIKRVTVGVDEGPGQGAWCSRELNRKNE
jgi:6-pyruvoyltetrahydropterin/6-carboxytetrahydropterin synthase